MNINREPSAILSGLGALLASITKLLVILHIVAWDADQLAAVGLVVDSAIILLGALFIRSQVTPVSSPALPANTVVKVLGTDGKPTGDTTTI